MEGMKNHFPKSIAKALDLVFQSAKFREAAKEDNKLNVQKSHLKNGHAKLQGALSLLERFGAKITYIVKF